MLIEVYCSYCGFVIARFRKLMSYQEILRKTLSKVNGVCPKCGALLKELDLENLTYELKRRKLAKAKH